MTDTRISSLEQAYERIKELMAEEKFAEAHRACLEILRFDAENIEAIRLKNKIEATVKKMNRKTIEQNIKDFTPLWKEKKFDELLKNLKKLVIYIDDYPELKNIIAKAEKAYSENMLDAQKKYFDQEYKNILNCIKEKKFAEALRNSEKLRLTNLYDGKIKNLISTLRKQWIQYEIEENKTLIESEKFEDILLFYSKLKKIDPQSNLIEKLIQKTKIKYQEYNIDQKKEFIYQGIEKIKTLYQLKKYEKAMVAAKEILDFDPENKQAKSLSRKATKKTQNQIEKEVIAQMELAQKQLKTQYEKDKTSIKKL